jgi:hypothetical protein
LAGLRVLLLLMLNGILAVVGAVADPLRGGGGGGGLNGRSC